MSGSPPNKNLVWSMSGDQGAQWKQGNVSMSNAYADFYVSVIGAQLKISMSTIIDPVNVSFNVE